MNWSLEFFPFFPGWVLAALAALCFGLVVLSGLRNRRGIALRALSLLCFLAALANPNLKNEERQPLSNIAVVAVDESSSMQLAGRGQRASEIEAELKERLSRIPNLEVRWVHAPGAAQPGGETTNLFGALDKAMTDIPVNRAAGVIFITDGQIHDVPQDISHLGFDAPVHALIAGAAGEKDTRVEVVSAPRFGLVGTEEAAEIKAERSGPGGEGLATFEIRRATGPVETIQAPYGKTVPVRLRFEHAGPNIVEIELKPEPGELTAINNKTVIQAQGVRENLRVLLVSGEPHAGERTWRNLLRSDAAVDLVYFTILRPPEKHDGTPIDQLSLIAFPTRELFSEKLSQFDLIIFDRYQRRAVLPMIYLDNVARYVEQGGAVLVAAGADFASPVSLARTPLGTVLPARPTGRVVEEPFVPTITPEGEKHPVTAGLPGAPVKEGQKPAWGHWFRVVDAQADRGEVVMKGAEDKPLLVLDRRGKGRVALLLSDHAWLWARGYEGGGPHVDLLRRLAHWLMKEPELEEEALRATARAGELTVEQQTMADHGDPAIVRSPSGKATTLTLKQVEPGLWRATMAADEIGLYRVEQGERRAFAHVGPANPREFSDVRSTDALLKPLVKETGGRIARMADASGNLALPRIVPIRSGASLSGADWIGIRTTEASVLKGIVRVPLFGGTIGAAAFLALFVLLLMPGLTW